MWVTNILKIKKILVKSKGQPRKRMTPVNEMSTGQNICEDGDQIEIVSNVITRSSWLNDRPVLACNSYRNARFVSQSNALSHNVSTSNDKWGKYIFFLEFNLKSNNVFIMKGVLFYNIILHQKSVNLN